MDSQRKASFPPDVELVTGRVASTQLQLLTAGRAIGFRTWLFALLGDLREDSIQPQEK